MYASLDGNTVEYVVIQNAEMRVAKSSCFRAICGKHQNTNVASHQVHKDEIERGLR